MLIDIVLGIIVISLLVYHFIYVKETNRQIKDMVKAIMSRDVYEYKHVLDEKTDTKKEAESLVMPEYVPAESLNTDEFYDMLEKQTEGNINN